MAFDAEGFRNAAKGKFTDAEIEEVISRETASKPTAVSPSNTTTNEAAPTQAAPTETAPSEFSYEGRNTPLQRIEAFNKKVASDTSNSLPSIDSDVAGGLGAAGLEYAIYRTLRDKPPPPPPPPAGTFTPPPPPPPGGAAPVNAPRREPTFDPLAPADMTMSAGEPILGEKLNNPPMYADDEQRTQRQQYQQRLDEIEKARSDARQGIVTQTPQPIAEVPPQAANPAVEQLKARVNAIPTPEASVPPVPTSAAEQTAIDALNGTTATETPPATNEPAPAPEGANAPVIPTQEQKATAEKVAKEKLTWPGLAEEKGPIRWMANTIGTVKDVKGSQAAFEIAKDKLEALGVDLSPTDIKTGKKVGGGLIPEGHAVLNDFYKTYTGEDLPKGGKILTEQKMKLFDAVKTHLEEAHANGNLKTLGKGAMAAAAVLGISGAVQAAMNGDTSKLKELGFDLGVSAIPIVGTAAAALTGTTLPPATLRSDAFAEVLNRPEVRQTLKTMQQTLSPADYNKARDKYLEKVSTFPQYATGRFAKPNILGAAPVNRNTLLPVAPPR